MKELVKVKLEAVGDAYVQAVDARQLYLGLGLRVNKWARWSTTNILNSKFFKQGVDFIELPSLGSSPNAPKEFAITIRFAQHLAMMADTDNSHVYRDYFINCEKELIALKEEQARFFKFRESARLDSCDFMNAVYHNSERNLCGYQDVHGAREFDLLNVIVLGMKAAEFKQRNGLPSDLKSIRDNLSALQIEAIEYVQKADTILLEMDELNFNERYDKLKAMFDRKFGSRFVLDNNKQLLEQFA